MEEIMREQKALLEEQKAKMEADQALLNEYTREREIRKVRSTNNESRALRWIGRAAAGLVGTTAIVITGGLALPFVAVGAAGVESKLQEKRKRDQAKMRSAMSS
jgi:hypothetical protein